MNKDEWYRNKTWNKSIENHFNEKLKLVNLKQDYLRIQASCLTAKFPKASLTLLDQYFQLGVHFDMAHAWYERGVAYSLVDNVDLALEAFSEALNEEKQNPKLLTNSYLRLPLLVADTAYKSWYTKALKILEKNANRRNSYRDFFEWNAAYAIILSDSGLDADAKEYAQEALDAEQQHASGLEYHLNVGTMRNDEIHKRIRNKVQEISRYHRPSLKRRVGQMFR